MSKTLKSPQSTFQTLKNLYFTIHSVSSSALLESPVACRFLSRPSWCPRYSLDNLDTSLPLAALVSPSGSSLDLPKSSGSPSHSPVVPVASHGPSRPPTSIVIRPHWPANPLLHPPSLLALPPSLPLPTPDLLPSRSLRASQSSPPSSESPRNSPGRHNRLSRPPTRLVVAPGPLSRLSGPPQSSRSLCRPRILPPCSYSPWSSSRSSSSCSSLAYDGRSISRLLRPQPHTQLDGHHATLASPLLGATPHIAGDNYHRPIIGDTVVVGGHGNTYKLGQGRSPSLSRSHHLDI